MEHTLISTIHTHMTHTARTEQDFVFYPNIIRIAGIGHLGEGALEGALGNVLFEINQYDWSLDASRPMLSAIAVSSQTGYPGRGFYRFARDIGKLASGKEMDEVEFWIRELEALRNYWQTRSETVFKGVPITYQAVYEALKDFDDQYPDTGAYDQWQEKDGYKYALEFGGRPYPPKYILSLVAGIDVSQFSGGDQTNHVFEQLGMIIVEKHGIVPSFKAAVRHTYLLTWNPGRFSWETFEEDWDVFYMGSRPRFRWSCGNTKSIEVGDRVFLMRLGYQEEIKGIVASGIVTVSPFEAPHWHGEGGTPTALYIEFEPDVLLNPDTDDLLDPKIVTQEFDWYPQRSGITIPHEIVPYLEQVWQQHVQHLRADDDSPHTRSPKQEKYKEGSRKLVSSYRYERDPRAREACIKHYGTTCVVCGFDFGKVFGIIGEGYTHVHHLIPLSENETEYVIDPVEDLRPVCPNCHAMLHRKSPPYSIEELKYIRQQTAKGEGFTDAHSISE